MNQCISLLLYLQHDGAPPRFGRELKVYLDHCFPGQWIGRGGS